MRCQEVSSGCLTAPTEMFPGSVEIDSGNNRTESEVPQLYGYGARQKQTLRI